MIHPIVLCIVQKTIVNVYFIWHDVIMLLSLQEGKALLD